jgi:ATPase subunit of ABC transporter with duplicated ATPase domains
VVVASHDRVFLDAVCTDLIDLDPALDGRSATAAPTAPTWTTSEPSGNAGSAATPRSSRNWRSCGTRQV